MGSFINTNYSKTVDNLVKGSQERLNNPYYLFSSKKPTNVTYWNINIKKTTFIVFYIIPSYLTPPIFNNINHIIEI